MEFSNPEAIVSRIEIKKGMQVADFGTGAGDYAFALSRLVGPDGKVYAIDVQRDLLERVRRDSEVRGLHNIHFIWADLDEPNGSKLASSAMDAVVVANVLFQSEKKDLFLREVKRVIKPGGMVLCIDWSDSFGHMGPHPKNVLTETQAKDLFIRAGFSLVRSFHAGANHYGLIFTA